MLDSLFLLVDIGAMIYLMQWVTSSSDNPEGEE